MKSKQTSTPEPTPLAVRLFNGDKLTPEELRKAEKEIIFTYEVRPQTGDPVTDAYQRLALDDLLDLCRVLQTSAAN